MAAAWEGLWNHAVPCFARLRQDMDGELPEPSEIAEARTVVDLLVSGCSLIAQLSALARLAVTAGDTPKVQAINGGEQGQGQGRQHRASPIADCMRARSAPAAAVAAAEGRRRLCGAAQQGARARPLADRPPCVPPCVPQDLDIIEQRLQELGSMTELGELLKELSSGGARPLQPSSSAAARLAAGSAASALPRCTWGPAAWRGRRPPAPL